MPTPTPAIQPKPYAERIRDSGVDLSRAETDEYLADLRATLRAPRLPPRYRGYCLTLLAALLIRQECFEEALSVCREGFLVARDPGVLCNQGSIYLHLGRIDEALDVLTQATDAEFPDRSIALGNLSEAYWRAGAPAEALAVLQEAVNVADHNDPRHLYNLAAQSAELHLAPEALEFLARSLALRNGVALGDERAIDVLRRFREQYEEVLKRAPRLRAAIEEAFASEAAMAAPDEPPGGGNSEGALAMFEATRPMRQRAAEAYGGTSS